MRGTDKNRTTLVCESPKARMAVLLFDDVQPDQRKPFVKSLIKRIYAARKLNGGLGFWVKLASFFPVKEGLQVVLISKDSLRVTKWDSVFTCIGARSIKVFEPKKLLPSEHTAWTRNSLFGVTVMFKNVDIKTLSKNIIIMSISKNFSSVKNQHRDLQIAPMPKSKDRVVVVSKHAPAAAVCKRPAEDSEMARTTAARFERIIARDAVPPSCEQVLAAIPVFPPVDRSEYQKLVEKALAFMTSDSLDLGDDFVFSVYNHASRGGAQNVGTFLLDGRILHVFAHTLHLREFVQWVLGNVFHSPVNSLSLAELQPHFSSMSLEDQTLLESIATCSDAIPDHPSFLLIDRVSIAVFIALDILGGECAGVLRSDSVGQEFMAVHMSAVAEHVRMYVDLIYLLCKFMNRQVSLGLIERSSVDRFVFLDHVNEEEIFRYFVGDTLPHSIRSLSNPSRKKFRVDTLYSMVPRILKKFKIQRLGIAFDTWNVMQKAGVFFNRMRSSDAEYLLLPGNAFSQEGHSTDLNDVKKLAERVYGSLS